MRCLNPASNLDRLHRLQRHDRRRQQRIQPFIPLHIAAEAGRNVVRHHLKYSADRIAGAQNLIDFFLHALLGIGVGARKQHFILARQRLNLLPGNFTIRNRNRAHRNHMTKNFDTQFAQEQFRERANRNPRRRFPRRSAFQNIARFREIVLQRARQIGVARTRRRHAFVFLRIAGLNRQRLFPILPVAIFEHHGDGRADRLAVMDARKESAPGRFRSSCARRAQSPAGAARVRDPQMPDRPPARPAARKETQPAPRRGILRK